MKVKITVFDVNTIFWLGGNGEGHEGCSLIR